MTRIPLLQQVIGTLKDSLEQEMHIEEMVGYMQDCRLGSTSTEPDIMGLQNKIYTLTETMNFFMHVRSMRRHVTREFGGNSDGQFVDIPTHSRRKSDSSGADKPWFVMPSSFRRT